MVGEEDPRREPVRYRARPEDVAYGAPRSTLRRFLGGSPIGVLIKLAFLSVVVGAAMAVFGLTPAQLFWHLYDGTRALIELGLNTFQGFGQWILAGAVIVVPLWLLSRFLAMGK